MLGWGEIERETGLCTQPQSERGGGRGRERLVRCNEKGWPEVECCGRIWSFLFGEGSDASCWKGHPVNVRDIFPWDEVRPSRAIGYFFILFFPSFLSDKFVFASSVAEDIGRTALSITARIYEVFFSRGGGVQVSLGCQGCFFPPSSLSGSRRRETSEPPWSTIRTHTATARVSSSSLRQKVDQASR
ncbi:hypothetical protein CH063_13422 [Colletotrichum higginsianum]|uniref:Uncharacterized protein n=1 Tax=Colletotrichum higginsianum (strain IMI 349063) TaxID=759273 RepID=H1VUB8_COLHI|nr:hypothetical protein CH063_13422 [Colletotrichum higginsianum]